MVTVSFDSAVTTDKAAAIKTVYLKRLFVRLARWKGGLWQNVVSHTLFQLVQGRRLVTSKHLQYLVLFDTLGTDEHGALHTESFGLVSRAHLTLGLHLAVSSLHVGVHCFHAVDEERCREVVHTPLGEGGGFATLWAGEGVAEASSLGKVKDTLLAVVVTAREHLGVSVVLEADGARDLLLQLPHTFLHRVLSTLSHSSKLHQVQKRDKPQLCNKVGGALRTGHAQNSKLGGGAAC